MSFEVAADSYSRFMGRYAEPLAGQFVDLVGLRAGQRVLDVGCGPGALTSRLVDRLGASSVAAVDQLAELFGRAGLADIVSTVLMVEVAYDSVDAWWEPFTLGVGPAGAYVAELTPDLRDDLRQRCAALLPPAPFRIEASAWTALGRA